METKHFDLVHLLSKRKQNVLIWSAYCRNESKTIHFRRHISNYFHLGCRFGVHFFAFLTRLKFLNRNHCLWSFWNCSLTDLLCTVVSAACVRPHFIISVVTSSEAVYSTIYYPPIFLNSSYSSIKGTQDWEFFWLRLWNLRYFFVSYA